MELQELAGSYSVTAAILGWEAHMHMYILTLKTAAHQQLQHEQNLGQDLQQQQ